MSLRIKTCQKTETVISILLMNLNNILIKMMRTDKIIKVKIGIHKAVILDKLKII